MFSDKGAHANAGISRLVETAKANGLNVNAYLKYLLAEIAAHANNLNEDYITRLLH